MAASGAKILIVDDDENDRLLYSRTLGKLGLKDSVIELEDGQKAIEYLQREPAPNLLLLDLKMPGVSGFEVLEWMQGKPALKTLAVVVLSSSVIASDKARALELGATEFFTKADYLEMGPVLNDLVSRLLPGP